ncbi:cilia- and flagella-associated protein 36 [Anopheles bellator]|uniref:cilia- and flagella-associated protein 36 n=1 Tax=Anopheles bellator TaxID=139047 RepID=UPI0026479B32|nr:cilia- and flagella-associated protein 36 [Anopheles bellator]
MAEDNSWVFDSLVCFLHGPVWNAPLQTFIEDKSIIFDPSLQPDETNPEFRKVHDEYKNLVDLLLGSFMEEMQITPEQFEFACLEGRHVANLASRAASASTIEDTSASADERAGTSTFSFHQGLFQQIWAANDIRIFIRMMVQRNVELQLQALDLIERRSQGSSVGYDTHPQDGGSLDGETSDAGPSHSRMLSNSDPEETEGTHSEGELERDIIKSMENELNKPDGATTAEHAGSSVSSLKEVPEETDKFQRLNLFFDQEKINAEDMKSRQEYLRAQRDKILHIKKKARARQLNETIRKNDRPNSAQVAQKILEGDTETVPVEPPEASLQLRKMLAQRLRDEIAGEKE